MSSGIASLYKILKDESRRNIILLVNEKNSVSYTELLDATETGSTGLLNYHLKVLSDLLTKNESGQYIFTEKGKLASRLLLEFPEENRVGKKPKWWRKFWIAHAIFDSGFFIALLVAYFMSFIDVAALYRGILAIFTAIGIGYMVTHITKEVLSEKGLKKVNRAMYIFFGTVVLGFFLWIGLMSFLHATGIDWQIIKNLGEDFSHIFIVLSLIMCYIVCAFIGDLIGKITKYHVTRYP